MHPTEEQTIERFATSAARLCTLVESAPRDGSDVVLELTLALAELHTSALLLPSVQPETDAPDPPADAFGVSLEFIHALPIDLYWDVFDPLAPEPKPPVANSCEDDLRDIHLDLRRGLLLYDGGLRRDACWSWRLSFLTHWGEHLVGLQRALHLATRSKRA